ncbi:MAG: histidinol phosphate phosphatase [Candidatus Omnitrophica bacterium]|nr:histidinol phosphate phosphatase [Candidatus Omnitrophota bacterium]
MGSQRALLGWVERQVLACRPIALRHFRSRALRVERKSDRSPVTAADRAIEARLRRALARACPGESIVGEEFGRTGRDRATFWTLDPIDGTRAFSRGLPSWGIMVGRVERGRPALGLIDFPAVGVTIGVAPGVAAYERGRGGTSRLPRPRAVRSLREAVIFHGGAHWWQSTRYAAGFVRVARACFLERAYGDCYGYLWALRGGADAVLDYGVKVWDLVPLAALARATGRALTDCRGRPSWTGPDSIFASPPLARLIASTLRHA